MAKWAITIELINGSWAVLITHGRQSGVLGCATADDLETALSMAGELFEDLIEQAHEGDVIPLRPALMQPAIPDQEGK